MDLVGYFQFAENMYPVVVTSVKKNSVVYIVLSEKPVEDEWGVPRYWDYYERGGLIHPDYILGMVDISYSTSYGATKIVEQLLRILSEVRTQAILSKNIMSTIVGEQYYYGNSTIDFLNNSMESCDINEPGISVKLDRCHRLNFSKVELRRMLVADFRAAHVAQTTFLDSTLESLQLRGFKTDWYTGGDGKTPKNYVAIHTMEEFNSLVVPDFIRELKRWRVAPDFESFLTVIDWESTGFGAWCEKSDDRCISVFVGLSFKDDNAYGVFVNMENFDNVDNDELAQALTNMFQMDPLYDREITLIDEDGSEFKYMRSEIKTLSHHILIDIRFGLLIDADIWYDYCSMQIGFNTDPFLTRGHNGAKDRVTQFLGIEYAELADICGKGHEGRFRSLSDKRVIMMYGCADVDLVRLFAKKMITGIRECSEYLGVDQIEQFELIDKKYMNYKARFDYMGVRVDVPKAMQWHQDRTQTLDQYYLFMRYYIAKVLKFKQFYDLYTALLSAGKDVSSLEIPDFSKIEPIKDVKWSGKFLLDVLFSVCQYPVLVKTKPSKKVLAEGRPFKPKPAVDKDAVRYYLKFDALADKDRIREAIKNPQSLEDLKLASMYIEEDLIDIHTKKVLIDKDKFNSYRYPFFLCLKLIGPLEKSISADLEPLIDLKSPYRFAASSMNTVVTRRDVNTMCTVSGDSKELYLPYTDDYYMIDADQASVEIRIAFGLTGDHSLIDPLNDPEKDPHTEACSEFFNKPAYLVDKKTERKPIKFINFGRIYKRGEYSCCVQIHDGEVNAENLAHTAHLLEIFDEKRAPVHAALDAYRDDCWVIRDVPDFLKFFLKMNPEKQYGRMTNLFHWVQHVEIRDDPQHEASMKRKAGNFCVQGLASTLLRIIWVRFVDACWAKKWIQNKEVIPHLTVYDEILLSYIRHINPVELILILRDAFVVTYRDFPKLFIGINVVSNWGQSKADEYELPVYLVERLKREYKKGMHHELVEGDHVEYFRNMIDDYVLNRVKEVLLQINDGNKKVWWIEKLSEKFTNYTVRGMLFGYKKFAFKIQDDADPVESLLSVFAPFLSEHLLADAELAYIVCRGKKTIVDKQTYKKKYADENTFMEGKPIIEQTVVDDAVEDVSSEEEEIYYDFNDETSLLMGDEIDADEDGFESNQSSRRFDDDNFSAWDNSFMKEYFVPEGSSFMSEKAKILNIDSYLNKGLKPKISFKHFVLRNKTVVIKCQSMELCQQIFEFCKGKISTSTNAYQCYVAYKTSWTQRVGVFTEKTLHELDDWLLTINADVKV